MAILGEIPATEGISMADQAAGSWERLKALPKPTLAQLFAGSVSRVGDLSGRLELPPYGEILFDWSKTHLDQAHIAASRTWPR